MSENPATQPQQNVQHTGGAIIATEVERLLATSERLLRVQQQKVVQEKANYETTRTALLNEFKSKVAEFEHDTKEALFLLQQEHEARVHAIERLIAKLTALREA